jgi:hypothetical protein
MTTLHEAKARLFRVLQPERKARAMATTRSNLASRSTAELTSGQTPSRALASVARQGVRVQIAAFTAAGKAITGWAHAADRFAQAVGDELLRRADGETDSRELIVGVASATTVHLRELAALPSAAASHFDTRLSRTSTNS